MGPEGDVLVLTFDMDILKKKVDGHIAHTNMAELQVQKLFEGFGERVLGLTTDILGRIIGVREEFWGLKQWVEEFERNMSALPIGVTQRISPLENQMDLLHGNFLGQDRRIDLLSERVDSLKRGVDHALGKMAELEPRWAEGLTWLRAQVQQLPHFREELKN